MYKKITKLCLFCIPMLLVFLSYGGFCFTQLRFLTEDEIIKEAVNKVLLDYPTLAHSKKFYQRLSISDQDKDYIYNGYGSSKITPRHPVSYGSLDEFFVVNPKCCFITKDHHAKYKDDWGGDFTTFWSRVTGRKSSIVVVHYQLRYKNKIGELVSKEMEFYSGVSNCGKLVCDYCF